MIRLATSAGGRGQSGWMLSLYLTPLPWQMRDAADSRWFPAQVPGCVHTDLLRAGQIPDPFYGTNELDLQWIEQRTWEYRLEFNPPEEFLEQEHLELVADGLDTVATVMLNGIEIARTENMFIGYRWSVRNQLKPSGNVLLVRFHPALEYIRSHRPEHRPREINDPVGGVTSIRKEQCQFGWDWGPRLVTSGIWRDIRLEGWSGNRLVSVRVGQRHGKDGRVSLRLAPEMARPEARLSCHYRLTLGPEVIAEGQGRTIDVPDPQLWWPSGQGAQPLYQLAVEVRGAAGNVVGRWIRRMGLRTIKLDRHRDEWGQSFQFVVNGRAIFAKGANWIPAHSFVHDLTRADYQRNLRSAVEANMNMIRVWGGGIYESEDFFDLCDELGLLVWQDFMFACTLYPGDKPFVESIRVEAAHQIRRLRHRASLALWCGNNEVWGCNAHEFENPEKQPDWDAYEAVFHQALPAMVKAHDPATAYWPSSPWRGDESTTNEAGISRGDTHFWEVWHGRAPVATYEKWPFRFVSEFGMQSYSSPATNATFCPPENNNIFGPAMENHQKNIGGNQVILDYVSRRYRFPKSQDSLIYLSQLNQAHCMQTGVEFYRRNRPRCMGALYWQLNDCWPVASWSSIEFTGRWRALHHVARRFFAPLLVTAQLHGEETVGIGNLRQSTVHAVDLHVVSDRPEICPGVLHWDLFHLDGRRLLSGSKKVKIAAGTSAREKKIELAKLLAKHAVDHVYLRIALDLDGVKVSEETVFLTAPRFLDLPRPSATRVQVSAVGGRHYELTFTSAVFQHRFAFDLADLEPQVSDNFFELYPDEPKRVQIRLSGRTTIREIREKLTYYSLVDSYGGAV